MRIKVNTLARFVLQVKEINIDEEGNQISLPHVYCLTPDTDIETITNEEVKAKAKEVWTPEVIQAYKDSLPKPEPLTKELLLNKVKIKFETMFRTGTFMSSLGFSVDNRRYGKDNDKDNVLTMINMMNRNSLAQASFTDANGTFQMLTLSEWERLLEEMENDGLSKYEWKWKKEEEIKQASNLESIEV